MTRLPEDVLHLNQFAKHQDAQGAESNLLLLEIMLLTLDVIKTEMDVTLRSNNNVGMVRLTTKVPEDVLHPSQFVTVSYTHLTLPTIYSV